MIALSRETTDCAKNRDGSGVSGSVETAKNGVVDDAISPGEAARSIGAALQQHPFEITDVSHDGTDGAQQL